MRIVIDLQAAQSAGSRHRGIGRYSVALAKAMLRNRGSHEVLIALNGMFSDTLAGLRENFAGLLPPQDIRVWHATIPARQVAGAPPAQREAAELVREAFLASLDADVVHVASMFEGDGFSLASVHAQPDGPLTAVTLYDLIPHIYPDIYLDTPQAKLHYEEKLAHLRRADIWLAISASSRREGVELLGLPPERVTNISSDADAHFTVQHVPQDREAALRQGHGLARPYVMYTGGIDHRKNIEGLIGAWAALPQPVRAAHQLAIVCSVQPRDRARLELLVQTCGLGAADVVFTGFVPEPDLVDLYRLCKLFVFPSQHEGFGLPALEAMRCGAPVIGADNSSIPEVVGRADALFDAGSQPAMTAKILQCLEDGEFRAQLVAHGRTQSALFSWDVSARAAIAAFEQAVRERAAARPAARPRLAFVSPMPPQRSGIADYSAELLPALARHYDIDLVLDQPTLDAPQAVAACKAQRSAQWFMQHGHEYDRVLYQFGNSSYHDYMFALLERHPGTVVLHDFDLSGVIAHRELDDPNRPSWSRALYTSHGWPALALRWRARDMAEALYAYPANFDVLRQAAGVIVHSSHAMQLARRWYGPGITADWECIPLLRTPAGPQRKAAARERLGLAAGDFIVCSFGMLGPIKLNHRLLRGWRASPLAQAANCQLLFVGEPQRSPYCKSFDEELGWQKGNVRVTGWNDAQAYSDYLDAADVAVQLRTMSRGETSAAVLDCMNHGLPTIANREGSMAALDPQAVLLLPREFTDEELAAALDALWKDPARREAMGARGREIVHTLHAPQACAAAYAHAIDGFARRAAGATPRLVRALGAVLPADTEEPLFAALARAIASNVPDKRPARQLLVDVTAIAQYSQTDVPGTDALPQMLRDLIEHAPPGWRCEPVVEKRPGSWRYARMYMQRQIGSKDPLLSDEAVEVLPQDLWCQVDGHAGDASLPPQAAAAGLTLLRLPAQGSAALTWAVLAATAPDAGHGRWFIDISELVVHDWQSGIQRVVKNDLMELLLHPPADVQVVPVCATDKELGYRTARDYMMRLAGIGDGDGDGDGDDDDSDDDNDDDDVPPPLLEPRAGDVFFGLDLQPHIIPVQADYLAGLRARGVHLAFMVYDLLPLQLPDCFVPGAAANHERWMRVVAQADLAICISQAVADELAHWIAQTFSGDAAKPSLQIRAVHLGGDMTHAMPSRGLPPDAADVLAQLRSGPSFLMVGTIEPRKSHARVLAAFELLWAQGHDVRLVIAGRPGWLVDALLEQLRSHPERNKRLFWIEDGSDEYLDRLYEASACLIAASRGEGFGLPLIEAAQHKVPVIARDIPVFREVAGSNAFYFRDDKPSGLASALLEWLSLHRRGREPRSTDMTWLTWAQSAARIKQVLAEHDWNARAG